MMQPDAPQDGGIEHGQDEADHGLPAHEARHRVVDLPPEGPDLVAVLWCDPSIDRRNHPVPIDGQIDGHDRGHDQKRPD